MEASQFRDAYPSFQAAGAQVVGISPDPHATQCAFAQKLQTPFPLVGDETGAIIERYGLRWPLLGGVKRQAFVVDRQGRIAASLHREVRVEKLVGEVLEAVRALTAGAPPGGQG